jgi:hypothetical protein
VCLTTLLCSRAFNQIITDYRVFAERPSDRDLLVPAVQAPSRCIDCCSSKNKKGWVMTCITSPLKNLAKFSPTST